jgi:hypothetical protein
MAPTMLNTHMVSSATASTASIELMIFSDLCMVPGAFSLGAKLRKVESKTKEFILFFAETE